MLFQPPITNLSQLALQWLSQYAVEGVFTTDTDLYITAWNHWLTEQTGNFADAVLDQHIFNIYPSIVERNLDYLRPVWRLLHQKHLSRQGSGMRPAKFRFC